MKTNFNLTRKRRMLLFANLNIVGEAARLLPDEIKAANSQVPWRDISGMRNHLIHRYFKVDIEEVWRTAQNDLTLLKEEIEKILENLS